MDGNVIDFRVLDLSRGHGAGFIGSLAGQRVIGEDTPGNLREIAGDLLRHAHDVVPADGLARAGRALFLAAGVLEDVTTRLAALERAAACMRGCEEPGCAVVCPAAFMVRLADGSWFCPAHVPADPDSPILPQSLTWTADGSAAPAGA